MRQCLRRPSPFPESSAAGQWTIRHMALSSRVMNLLFGRPLATSEERAEHIGPIAGIPVFGLDALSSAAYGPEAALTLLIPLGLLGVHYIVPVSAAIVVLLDHRLLQLPADHRRLSARRRLLHRGQPEPGRGRGPAGRGGADDRLHPHRRGGHLGRRGRAHLRRSRPAALHAATLPGRAADSHHREHARRARHRRGVHDSHLPVHRHAADRDRRRARGRCCTAAGHPHPVTPLPAIPARHRRWSACGCCSRSFLPAARP